MHRRDVATPSQERTIHNLCCSLKRIGMFDSFDGPSLAEKHLERLDDGMTKSEARAAIKSMSAALAQKAICDAPPGGKA